MTNPNLFFNILTFEFPSENKTFYFTKDDNGKGHKIHKTLFPKEIDSIFPGISNNGTDFSGVRSPPSASPVPARSALFYERQFLMV